MSLTLHPIVGSVVRVSVTFTQLGVTTDPMGTITFYAESPTDAVTTITFPAAGIVKDGAGLYHTDVPMTMSGEWNFRFEAGVGAGQATDETSLFVSPSRVIDD